MRNPDGRYSNSQWKYWDKLSPEERKAQEDTWEINRDRVREYRETKLSSSRERE